MDGAHQVFAHALAAVPRCAARMSYSIAGIIPEGLAITLLRLRTPGIDSGCIGATAADRRPPEIARTLTQR